MLPDLLAVAEESRTKGYISGTMNAIFIALIAKKNTPSFVDYIPISIYNMLYKIISKLIATRIKRSLSKHITLEQFGFLDGRQIQNAIEIAQECLHTIITRRRKACMLKIDLVKSYDCVDWEYMRFVLNKVGIDLFNIKWIKACITTTNYAFLINGSPKIFFRAFKGLRQGFSLSPLLFLIIMDGLSCQIRQVRSLGLLSGVHVISRNINITHLMFVDELLFGRSENRQEWQHIYQIMFEFWRPRD